MTLYKKFSIKMDKKKKIITKIASSSHHSFSAQSFVSNVAQNVQVESYSKSGSHNDKYVLLLNTLILPSYGFSFFLAFVFNAQIIEILSFQVLIYDAVCTMLNWRI